MRVSRLQTLAAYLRDQALAAGYRLNRRGKHALAAAVGISYDDLNATLAGRRCPDPVELERLADALGVSLVTLLIDSGFVRSRDAGAGQ